MITIFYKRAPPQKINIAPIQLLKTLVFVPQMSGLPNGFELEANTLTNILLVTDFRNSGSVTFNCDTEKSRISKLLHPPETLI